MQWFSNIVTCVGNIYSSMICSVYLKKICKLIHTLFILHSDFSILLYSWKMLGYDLLVDFMTRNESWSKFEETV